MGKREAVKRLYEGEKYVDPHKNHQIHEKAQREKNLTTNGFRYSSPNKLSSGLGNYWGCIGPKLKHEPEYNVLTKADKPGPVVHEARQVLTQPPRKGYGSTTPGNIFGPGPAKGEASSMGRYGGKEYDHAVDPYDLARQKEAKDRKENAELLAGRPPFKTVRAAHRCWGERGRWGRHGRPWAPLLARVREGTVCETGPRVCSVATRDRRSAAAARASLSQICIALAAARPRSLPAVLSPLPFRLPVVRVCVCRCRTRSTSSTRRRAWPRPSSSPRTPSSPSARRR